MMRVLTALTDVTGGAGQNIAAPIIASITKPANICINHE